MYFERRWKDYKHLATALIIYIIFASIFGIAYRFAMNPDGISELRLAGYIAEGHFIQSVTSSWSPLIIWIFSGFMFLGFDGLAAARITIALCGAGLLFCSWLLVLRFDLQGKTRFVAILIAALLISDWTIQNIGADVPFAALILLYAYFTTDSRLITDTKIAFLCGITGGFAFLAHHYALPFFMVHYPAVLLLRRFAGEEGKTLSFSGMVKSWGFALTGFLIIASLWIGIVSFKYGHVTISAKGNIAHAAVGPPDMDRRNVHFYGGLHKPKNDYSIHVYEDPSDLPVKTWSPFWNREYFVHQMKLIRTNMIHIFNHFVNQSPFFSYAFMVGVLLIIPLSMLITPFTSDRKFIYIWSILTFCIFSSGYVLIIARSPRRFYALMILFLVLSFHFSEQFMKSMQQILTVRRSKYLASYLLLIFVMAFSLKPGIHFVQALRDVISLDQVNPYKEIAGNISAVDFPSPYAFIRSSQKPQTDYYIAYYLNKQFLGRPLSKDIDSLTQELKQARARSLIVFDNQDIVVLLKNDRRYGHLTELQLGNKERFKNYVDKIIKDHEVVTGWDKEANIFILK